MGGKNSTEHRQEAFEQTTLDIAVTGTWGVGKSSLVNALRGLSDYDEGAAETGALQPTMEPVGYPHSTVPDVIIWDLPGIRPPNFKAEEYLERVNGSQYDFFIFVVCNRFTAYDIELSHAIQKMKKQIYYVRSKVDISVEAAKRKPGFSEEATLQNIRKYCLNCLVKAGISSLKIFLTSVWNQGMYDFPLLLSTLKNDIAEFRKYISRPAALQDTEKRNHDGSTNQGLNELKKNTFEIAITGVSGAGKSSFVNALRGISDFDEEAAKTDVIEGTMEPTGYPHPTFQNVTIWDLPGIGTPNFKAEEYLERVNYRRYNFFIIVASNRFTDYDIQLSHAAQEMGKQFYYVRSKMDNSIKNEKIKPDFNEEATIQKIRKYCLNNLVEAGVLSPEVFLISSWYRDKYDFPLLRRTLENVMDESHERSTELSLSIGIYNFISKTNLTLDLAKLRGTVAQKSLKEVTAEIRRELDALENAKLNIAITGASGAGKSSFVNALRGMTDYEEGAASTGVKQTTMEIHEYPHPLFPNVILWDLPGIGTPEFLPKDYLQKVNFSKYDFFILVSSERFTLHDAMLAEEIQKMKKKFYYVRSKMDVSMASEARNPDFDMDKTIEEIRDYCCENLKKARETSPRVFLISRHDLDMYDFPLLQEALENDMDGLKKHAFIASLPVFSRIILTKKKAAMEDLIWKVAHTSCNIAMIPVPGSCVICDWNILVVTMKLFYKVFGLDEDSLRRAAKLVGKDYDVLKAAIKKSPVSSEITPEFISGLLAKSWLCWSVMTVQTVLDFVPLLGSLAGGASSFISTFHMLKRFLKDIVEDAENVRATATESSRRAMEGKSSTPVVSSEPEEKSGREKGNFSDLTASRKTTLDIAITGLTGAGKSSLVNALRGLSDFDDEAAKTDMIEGTTEPMGYPHPTFQDITIWDLPGIGTPNFEAKEYLERVNYSQYDFFIIVASNSFTVYDIQLSHAIRKMKKQFYYVWSKMDLSISNEKLNPDFNEEAILQKVRKCCSDNLVKAGISSPHIFLVSSWYPEKYDFPLLQKTLENEIKAPRRHILTPADKSTKSSKGSGIHFFLPQKLLKIDLAKLKDALMNRNLEEVTEEIRQELDELENVKLDIAITGVSGAGKSSLVNALRGMSDYEEGAAEVGIMQTTMECHAYPHPLFPNVTIWDLPGIGTPEFKPQDYLRKVNFSQYDFFMIVGSERFTENDVLLAQEIKKMKKTFYFVRSKMDDSIAAEIRRQNFNMEKSVQKIREYVCDNLKKTGQSNPRVFLISSRNMSMYDFPDLQETLENDLDDLKRHALIMAMPLFSRKILAKKKAAMEALIWKLAIVSCVLGAIPIPGLSFACDLGILTGALIHFYKAFGLDEESLRRVAKVFGKDYQVLKSAIKKSPMSSEITPKFVIGLLGRSLFFASLTIIELVLDFVPVLGTLFGGASSFVTTFFMLRSFLKDIVEDAESVRAKATEP
ncbi:uncharacterized protein LOC132585834 [Heteronotia binoei]|uniref:uncharacterized protein LOC132585834 n=1 Tax=Heteronotia binoei TaxID=13085 RepID=UPI0029310F6C|nr:uncharacterized protein LOC132585834 [Heteronotia binoei]